MIDVPAQLAAYHERHSGAPGQAWIGNLPWLAEDMVEHWRLRIDGPPRHGMLALVLPVRQLDGSPAALKLQPVDDETAGEAVGLRRWDGNGVVRLLDQHPDTGSLLLERLDASRPLSTVADEDTAVRILAELLARLDAVPAPDNLRHLADIAARMVDDTPDAIRELDDPAEQQLITSCSAAVMELLDEPGNQLLHWDLHYDNILAGHREPWLAIDPKPLAGDPGFDILPALHNRWDEARNDVRRVVLRRFDRLTEALGIDRRRAAGWTLGRILQNALWNIEDGESEVDPAQVAIARTILTHRS